MNGLDNVGEPGADTDEVCREGVGGDGFGGEVGAVGTVRAMAVAGQAAGVTVVACERVGVTQGGLAWNRATLAREASGHLCVIAAPMTVSSAKRSGTHWMKRTRWRRWGGMWASTAAAGSTSSSTPTA